MQKYELVETVTKDKLVHQGIYFEPKKKTDTAILWVHGFTSAFYKHIYLFDIFTKSVNKNGWGFAAFNNRGHDMIAGLRRVDPQDPTGFSHASGGAGREKFEECTFDIDAGITFLTGRGYSKIILLGHSTGAIKCSYYAGFRKDSRLKGVILAGPLSDRLTGLKNYPELETTVRKMKRMVKKGKGEFLVNNLTYLPVTPKRYISMFDKGTAEDHMDYGEAHPKMKYYTDIKTPLLVVISENDEYLDRSPGEVIKVFDKFANSKNYKSVILKDATHGFEGKEKEFVKVVTDWINQEISKKSYAESKR